MVRKFVVMFVVVSGLAYGIGKGINKLFLSHPAGNDVAVAAERSTGKAEYRVGDRLQVAPQKQDAAPAPASPQPFQEVNWFALVPKGWDPMKKFSAGMDRLNDADPRAMEALQELRDEWDHAPTEPSMDGARIRIPGFVVPLETDRGQLKEFLLVPYFGACIHTPPPPANQIIHVFADKKPLKNVQAMDAVWVSGTLKVARSRTVDNAMGLAGSIGYEMKAEIVTPYKGQ